MHFQTIVALAGLTTVAFADYRCTTNQGSFTITSANANAAKAAGGTTVGTSGYPHAFGGASGGGAQLKFYGADPRCNQVNPALFEYPVNKDGSIFPKNQKRDQGTPTPARVVYTQDGSALCGVMTHVIEDPTTHQGSGDFRVCDSI